MDVECAWQILEWEGVFVHSHLRTYPQRPILNGVKNLYFSKNFTRILTLKKKFEKPRRFKA